MEEIPAMFDLNILFSFFFKFGINCILSSLSFILINHTSEKRTGYADEN